MSKYCVSNRIVVILLITLSNLLKFITLSNYLLYAVCDVISQTALNSSSQKWSIVSETNYYLI